MSLSTYAETALLKHLLGEETFTPPSLFVGLSKADPGDNGAGNDEPISGGYARVAFSDWLAASDRKVENNTRITFAEITEVGGLGTATYFTIWDAMSGGNMIWAGLLAESKSLDAGVNPYFEANELDLYFASGAISNYLANALLDHLFGTTVYTTPTIYGGGATTSLTDISTGSTVVEPSSNYARKAISAWDAVVDGASENTSLISYDTATGAWGIIADIFIADALVNGNILMYGTMTESQNIQIGDNFQIPAGLLDIAIS